MEWAMPGLKRILRTSPEGPVSYGRTPRRSPLRREGFRKLSLILEAYWMLVRFERWVARGDFRSLYDQVRGFPLRNQLAAPDTIERICSAVDLASIWYWKRVRCLERSASTACLLRSRGVPAQLVIGAQCIPFKAHAWVEVYGRVVNDKPYVREIYAALDRC